MNLKHTALTLLAFVSAAFCLYQKTDADTATVTESPELDCRVSDPCRIAYTDAEKMIIAVRDGDVELLQRMVDTGMDVNARAELQRTALFYAACQGKTACVEVLLAAPGVDVNVADADGLTPLIVASMLGHTECVRMLLAAPGIDVNKKYIWGTPLASAIENGHSECAAMLRAAGAR